MQRAQPPQAAEFQQQLLNNLVEGIFGLDTAGQFTFLNPAACNLLGYPNEAELLGKKAHEVCHHTTLNKATYNSADCPINQALQTGKAVKESEDLFWRRDGTILHVLLQAAPIHNSNGAICGVVVSFQDITERKRLEHKLQHSHYLLNYIIEHNRAAVAVHDTNMKYIYVSQRYLEDFNLEQQDIIGRHHYEVFPDLPEKWRQTHQKVLKGEVISADDDLYVTNEGKKYWTRWECRPWYKDDNSIGGLIIYTEVTNQRKETEEKLQFDLKLQKVIAEISANFAKTHEKELDNAINNSLARIGELFGIDRCYICLFSIGDNSITKTHEWRTSNHTASLKTPNKLLLTDIPWLTNKICSGERAYIPTLDDLPEEAQLEKDLLKFHNIHSVACLPILDDNLKPIGFMGLDMLSDNFTWPEQQICMLQVIAEIIGNTISRIEARRELKQREEQYRQLAERFREANSKLESAYRTKTDC